MHERRARSSPTDAGAPLWVVLAGGLATTVLVLAAGWAVEHRRFGPDLPAAVLLVERDVSEAVTSRAESLRHVTRVLAGSPDVIRALERPDEPAGDLFDALERAAGPDSPPDLGLIAYAAPRTAVAWRGRPSAIPVDRLEGPATLFVAPAPLGLRLVNVEPVVAPDGSGQRVGVIVGEIALSPSDSVSSIQRDGFLFESSRVPVLVRPHITGASPPTGTLSFSVASPLGDSLVDAFVDPDTIDAARARWRRQVQGAAVLCLALTILVAITPVRRSLQHRASLGWALTMVLIVAARLLLWFGLPTDWRPPIPLMSEVPFGDSLLRSPVDVLLTVLAAAGIVAAAGEGVLRWRLWCRSHASPNVAAGVIVQLAAGAVTTAWVLGFDVLVATAVGRGSFDATQLSLTPWEPERLTLLAGILLGHAVVVWGCALVFAAAVSPWRRLWNASVGRALVVGAWLLPVATLPLAVRLGPMPAHAAVAATIALSAALAWMLQRGFGWYRHASYGRQLGALAAVVVVPSLALYPALWSAAERAREHVVETRFVAQTLSHPGDLQTRLTEALAQIDAHPGLMELVATPPEPGGDVRPDAAFALWQRTALAESRLTSAHRDLRAARASSSVASR